MHRRHAAWLLAAALLVAACGGTPPSPRITLSPSASPFVSAASGDYRLELQLAKLVWRVGEPMTGTARLRVLGPSSANLVGAGSGLVSFDYIEAGGQRQLLGVSTADCAPHDISPATPITAPLSKAGSYDTANPSDAWIGDLMRADGVQLPAGTWDVTARAEFTEGSCDGPRYSLTVTVRVLVEG